MVIHRVSIQNVSVVMPGTFATSTEITSVVRAHIDSGFCIIKPEDYTPCLTVERKSVNITVTATAIARTKKVFDEKIGANKVKNLPPNYTFHFNLDGKVLGVRSSDLEGLPLDKAKQIVIQSGLTMVPLVYPETKNGFVGLLLQCVLDEVETPWGGTLRTGFYIGASLLRHTNKITLPGIVAIAIPLNVGVRIKGIFKHAPSYAETVFWFELGQCAPTIFKILEEEELASRFMENLDKCL
jgi:hypothetical protein